MKIREYKNEYYNEKKSFYENLMKEEGKMLNVKYLKKELAQLKKRYLLVESGAQLFAQNLEDVAKAEKALERLGGQYTAVKEVIDEVNKQLAKMFVDIMSAK